MSMLVHGILILDGYEIWSIYLFFISSTFYFYYLLVCLFIYCKYKIDGSLYRTARASYLCMYTLLFSWEFVEFAITTDTDLWCVVSASGVQYDAVKLVPFLSTKNHCTKAWVKSASGMFADSWNPKSNLEDEMGKDGDGWYTLTAAFCKVLLRGLRILESLSPYLMLSLWLWKSR